MDKELLIEKSWLSYRQSVIPKNAGPTQLIESRRAFYAGAQGLFTILVTILEPGQEATDADLATMDGIDAELKRFLDAVKAGLA